MSPTIPSTAGAWRVRHEGSPKSIDHLTPQDVVEGLQEGRWETTDEVRGPNDADWLPIETHPLFEEAAAEIEPPPPHIYDDETRLDMTPLIDVCLVLLVFFILTTSYAALSKRLEAGDTTNQDLSKMKPVMSREKVEQTSVCVLVKQDGDKASYLVEKSPVAPESLASEIRRYVGKTGKTVLFVETEGDVSHGAVIKVHDAARGAH